MTHHETAERLFRQLRGEVAARLRHGDSLEHVERELIAPSELTEELQSRCGSTAGHSHQQQ